MKGEARELRIDRAIRQMNVVVIEFLLSSFINNVS